jgi:hypothetical protein
VVLRGEDANLSVPEHAEFISVTVQKRRTCAGRPRVFMALHGANTLASPELDAHWSYVRSHLDGIWWNAAGVSPDESAAILRKITARHILAEQDLGKDTALRSLESFGRFENRYPDIRLIRDFA